uniref:Ribonuclease H1 n=1 Tax=Macrostomum lignano TaxID=282301 RepID=A0A1I8IL64_9PLAT
IRSAVTAVRHPTSLILLSAAPAPPCRMPFYAVKRGLVTGVFNTWLECQAQVVGFPGARYKKFSTVEEAQMFVSAPHTPPRGTKRKRSPTPPPANPPLIVYTDGACHSNGRDNSRAGIGVYFGDGHPWNVAERHPGRQTNNAAEIAAAKRAVEIAEREGVEALEVRTDSQFLISCLTAWLPKWRRNGWRLSDGGTVRVRQEIESLADLLDSTRVRVNFRHVRGHSGNHGNEMADRLANQGADAPLLGEAGAAAAASQLRNSWK